MGWMEDWSFPMMVDVRERWVDLRRPQQLLPNSSHDDEIVQIVPYENHEVVKTMDFAELIDSETMVEEAFLVTQMGLDEYRVAGVMDVVSLEAANFAVADFEWIVLSRSRNLLNMTSYRWDCCLMTMSKIWFDFVVVVTVVDCFHWIQHISWRHVNAERAEPISKRSCIWFCMSNRRNLMVLWGGKKIMKISNTLQLQMFKKNLWVGHKKNHINKA